MISYSIGSDLVFQLVLKDDAAVNRVRVGVEQALQRLLVGHILEGEVGPLGERHQFHRQGHVKG